jgi:broad specificity phosphatase PhoE
MVAHGGVIRVILSEILKTDALSLARFEVPYACVSQIRIYHHGSECYPQLVFHNA